MGVEELYKAWNRLKREERWATLLETLYPLVNRVILWTTCLLLMEMDRLVLVKCPSTVL